MTAGYDMRVRVWRIIADEANDDEVGGARTTGTMLYDNVQARIQSNMPSQLLLQQGLETLRTYTCLVRPGTMVIEERDELEVTAPYTHPYYGQRFRINGVLEQSLHPGDYRGYLMLSLTHSEVAHANQ